MFPSLNCFNFLGDAMNELDDLDVPPEFDSSYDEDEDLEDDEDDEFYDFDDQDEDE